MRKRKNKKKKQVNGYSLPVPFAGLIVLIFTLALAYVWLNSTCESIGRSIKKLEKENALLQKKVMHEEYRWSCMRSPKNLERALARCGLHMTWPKPSQIIRITDVSKSELVQISSGVNISALAKK